MVLRSASMVSIAAVSKSAEASLERLDALARRVADLSAIEPDPDSMAEFVARMDDDLDTAAVCALVFGLVSEVNRLLDREDVSVAAPLVAAWREILGALGLELRERGEVPPEILELAGERDAARRDRDFARADELRDRIVAAGFVVEDGADGTAVRPA